MYLWLSPIQPFYATLPCQFNGLDNGYRHDLHCRHILRRPGMLRAVSFAPMPGGKQVKPYFLLLLSCVPCCGKIPP